MTRVLRVSFALGGAAFVALGVLAAVIAIEGRNGPTTLLGRLGHIWELASPSRSSPSWSRWCSPAEP